MTSAVWSSAGSVTSAIRPPRRLWNIAKHGTYQRGYQKPDCPLKRRTRDAPI